MSTYTTGEIAKLCDITVRTVQYYDKKGILVPSELTEGGRRIYSEEDLNELKRILMLKSLGLSLEDIRVVLIDAGNEKVLETLLLEQEKMISDDIMKKQEQIDNIHTVLSNIHEYKKPAVNSIEDIRMIMKGKKELKKVYSKILLFGILLDLVEILTIVLWIVRGIWIPFAVGMPFVILCAGLMVKMYFNNVNYICPECHEEFKPDFKEAFWAAHTYKTRKLTCKECGVKGWCVEVFDKDRL